MKFKKLLNKLERFSGKSYFWLILLVTITSLVFIPAFKMEFWWVDDGWDILVARQILQSMANFNLEWVDIIFNESGGRLRTVYWLYQAFEYLVGGNNPTIHFLVHYLVIIGAALFIFRTVLYLTKSGFLSFFSSIMYVLIPINTENIFRLGPQEPLLGLFLIASVYYLLKNRVYIAIFLMLFAVLTKENGFVLWMPILFYYLTNRLLLKSRDVVLEKYALWGVIFTIPVILNTLLRRGGYSGFYTFEVGTIMGHFRSYLGLINEAFSPLLLLFVSTFIFRSIVFFRTNKSKSQRREILLEGMFLLLFLGLILVQSPWAFVLNRYIMPATVGLVIFLGMEVAAIRKYLTKTKMNNFLTFFGGIFALYLISFIWMNAAHVFLSGQLSSHQTSFIQSLYRGLAKEVPENGIILLNFREVDSTRELVVETAMHLDLFYNRPDIKVDYLRLGKLPESDYIVVGTPQVPEQYTIEEIEKSIKNYKKDASLATNNKYLVLTTPLSLFKQIVKKSYNLIANNTPFTSEGIYTYYISQDYWYKYYVNK